MRGKHLLTNYESYRQQLVKPICDYFSLDENCDEGSDYEGSSDRSSNKGALNPALSLPYNLILDGTGPRLTRHLPYLNGMGSDLLGRFNTVYAFSGGIGAYCIYLAQINDGLRHNFQHYFTEIDQQVRIAHKLSPMQYLALAKNYFFKKPLYNTLCYMNIFRYVMKEDFLASPIDQIAPNFIPYVALPERIRPVAITADNGFDRSLLTVSDVIAMGMKVPYLYSEFAGFSERKNTCEQYQRAFDAVYTAGYQNTRLRLSDAQASTVVLTTFSHGLSENACILNILRGKNPSRQILFDIMALVLNLPNKRYRRDIQLAYL